MDQELNLSFAWREFLGPKTVDELLGPLQVFLKDQSEQGKIIFPPKEQILRAFDLCPPDKCKCVILGQDPYHGDGQAHGLAFSVDKEMKLPPSLRNIFKEYEADLGFSAPTNGDLSSWAKEGVLLLNTVLTVEKARPGAHFKKGWEKITDHVVQRLGEGSKPLAFILWGAPSQKKKSLIKASHHLVLEAPHPSPLSSYRGFFGSRPFTKVNNFLNNNQLSPIDWKLP